MKSFLTAAAIIRPSIYLLSMPSSSSLLLEARIHDSSTYSKQCNLEQSKHTHLEVHRYQIVGQKKYNICHDLLGHHHHVLPQRDLWPTTGLLTTAGNHLRGSKEVADSKLRTEFCLMLIIILGSNYDLTLP